MDKYKIFLADNVISKDKVVRPHSEIRRPECSG